MKKQTEPQLSLLDIDRNPLVLLAGAAITAAIVLWGMSIIKDVNPKGFFVLLLGALVLFQTLWLLLNPFAQMFSDKLEIRISFIHQKKWYFTDISKVSDRKGVLYITYNDGEVEKISLFGIKPSHKKILRENLEMQVKTALSARL